MALLHLLYFIIDYKTQEYQVTHSFLIIKIVLPLSAHVKIAATYLFLHLTTFYINYYQLY